MWKKLIESENSTNTEQYSNSGILKGIPTSGGIIVAKSYVLDDLISVMPDEIIDNNDKDNEIARLETAYRELRKEFEEAVDKVINSNSTIKTIIESNLLIIKDDYIKKNIIKIINNGFSAESSVIKEFEIQKLFFKNSKDPILRERSIELDHIKQRLVSRLKHLYINYSDSRGKILIADNVTPTDLVQFVDAGIRGLITEVGGIASHVSIMARAYDIPSVIGVRDATRLLIDDSNIVLDGFSGIIYYNPSFSILKQYSIKSQEIAQHKLELGSLISVESKTIDNHKIIISINADKPDEMETAMLTGSVSIGLMRTETMIMDYGKIPDEDYQFQIYNKLAQIVYPNEITIRAFDIGSDKYSEGIPYTETNPALGFRGIRFLLARDDVFRHQIRAILRASVLKNIKLMIPMVTSLNEVTKTRTIIKECMNELDNQEILYDTKIKFGIMIETPAAVLISEILSKNCDFFSIGTNDLTQYTLAADRENNLVTDIYDSFHPAVLKQIQMTVESAHKNNIRVAICGELAGHTAATNLLIGLGIDELSVAPSIFLELKSRIINSKYKSSKRLVKKILDLDDSNSILQFLEENNN